jgi:hypothetical protein
MELTDSIDRRPVSITFDTGGGTAASSILGDTGRDPGTVAVARLSAGRSGGAAAPTAGPAGRPEDIRGNAGLTGWTTGIDSQGATGAPRGAAARTAAVS